MFPNLNSIQDDSRTKPPESPFFKKGHIYNVPVDYNK